MFDPTTEDRPLPQRVTRALIIGAVAVLVAIGAFTLIRDQFTEEEGGSAAEPPVSPSPPPAPAAPTRDGAAEEVDGWFPHSRAEFAEAGHTAEDFLAAAATIDFTRDEFGPHTERLGEWGIDSQAVTLTTADGIADGIWRALGKEESVDAWRGKAAVEEVRAYDPSSVHFLVSLEAEPVGKGEAKDMGEYMVIMTNSSGGKWRVELAEIFTD